jgi:hypothetical protein
VRIVDNKEIGREIVDWIHLAQDRCQLLALVNRVMKFNVHIKGGTFFH